MTSLPVLDAAWGRLVCGGCVTITSTEVAGVQHAQAAAPAQEEQPPRRREQVRRAGQRGAAAARPASVLDDHGPSPPLPSLASSAALACLPAHDVLVMTMALAVVGGACVWQPEEGGAGPSTALTGAGGAQEGDPRGRHGRKTHRQRADWLAARDKTGRLIRLGFSSS